ncbi:hypothetical protein [Gordonia malaquae]|uniref:hypothetical protein n=1 Tax=Gordonia malaquae TaxID=410332 RepID=UPI0030FEBDC2
MNWPEVIQAAGVAIAMVLGAWQARTAAKVKELERAVELLAAERDEVRHLFRVAVGHIRDWLAWSREHQHGTPPPPIPPELKDEV